MAHGISFKIASDGFQNYFQETTRPNWRKRADGGCLETKPRLSKARVKEEETSLHSGEEAFADRKSKHKRDVGEGEPIGYVLFSGT